MSDDWFPAMRECAAYWDTAPMLGQTFAALEQSFAEDNDACIDCAKCMVEVVCRIIIDELDDASNSQKPTEENPRFGRWVSGAIRVLKLGDVRDNSFQKLVSQHHKLTETLGGLRNGAGPVSHGKDGFIEKLSGYHRRAAVLSADAIVAFLHQAYLETETKLKSTKRPHEHFGPINEAIDHWATFETSTDPDGYDGQTISVIIGGERFDLLDVTPSQVLFQFDRTAYVEAYRQGQSLNAQALEGFDETIAEEVLPND